MAAGILEASLLSKRGRDTEGADGDTGAIKTPHRVPDKAGLFLEEPFGGDPIDVPPERARVDEEEPEERALNVEVLGPDDQRSHVERRINPAEAAVVVRIFELTVAGHGRRRIAHQLNAEGAPTPRAHQGRKRGWSASTVGDVLKSSLYRGEIT
jgi:hypothetical protein